MQVRGKKIFVGLSGGVDSAVSAALLKDAGARVTGVFIRGWYPPGMPCSWRDDRRDAMRVAARLAIPFFTLDASIAYKRGVIDYLLAEYGAGRTPNPDVMCNREVKFGAFYDFARAKGADAIATGHYRSGEKDQSYFLWAVPKDILAAAVFPVGTLSKSAVRTLARRFNLPVAEKKDSQGICFLGNVSVDEFLRAEFGTTPGRAVDERGREVGEHDGVLLHTIGERVALKGREPGPWFVRAKKIAHNELVVGRARAVAQTAPTFVRFENANWIGAPRTVVAAQTRYRGPRIPGSVEDDRFVSVQTLPEPVAPGQSIVWYDRFGALVGGGIMAQ